MSERGVWVATPDGLVPKHLYHRPIAARSELSAPMLIRDSMEPTWNPATGKHYDSKRKYEKDVKARGLEILGTESPRAGPKQWNDVTGEDVKAAIEQVETRKPTARKNGRLKRK